jgi:predicted Zn-dependent protease
MIAGAWGTFMTETSVVEAAAGSLDQDLRTAQEEIQRGNAAVALVIWDRLRTSFPDNPVAYLRAASTLTGLGRHDEAEALLRDSRERFAGNPGFAIEHAWTAHHRGDFGEATARWDEVRRVFPDTHAGYTGAANSLRSAGRYDEADKLLVAAGEKFSDDAAVRAEYAWLAHHRRNWSEAVSRWDTVRRRFPELQAGYTGGAVALRESGRHDDAEALLQSALLKFPGEEAPVLEHAWLATARRDWPEAARRWARVRESFPQLVVGFQRGAAALTEMWQYADAEALLTEGMLRFPNESELLRDYAWIALSQRREDEAAQRFARLCELFPNYAPGYIGGALCLRNQYKLREAEAILERGHALVPDDPRILLEHAQIPVFPPLSSDRNYDEALRRLEGLRAKFPQFEEGYIAAIRLMRDDDRLAEADSFGVAAVTKLPHSSALAIEHAHTARRRADWPEAMRRYADARERFPHQPHGVIGLASALSSGGDHSKAESLLRDAIERFPGEKAGHVEFASVAVRQSNWREALARWTEAYRKFPDDNDFAQRIFEARLRLTESDPADAEAAVQEKPPAVAADPRAEMRELIQQFESLGGRGIGCEFGMFQREFGAEPLGLLRWADMPYEGIIFVLENRFAGVGLPENTELFVDRDHGNAEYCTRDKRGFMFQRCFIPENDISHEKMWKQTTRRLPFLRDKLITDLEGGSKIFVWRQTERNLTNAELERLHCAVRSYGDNTLLYVRYQDDTHPNGTVVRAAAPGLLIGYIDRFKMLPTGELAAAPASASWTAICKTAFALWKEPSPGAPAQANGPLKSQAIDLLHASC